MKQRRLYVLGTAIAAGSLLLGGCDTTTKRSDVTLDVYVSSLYWIKDANVTLSGGSIAIYENKGAYSFYDDNVSGVRRAAGGHYVTNSNDEDNVSTAPITCPQFDTNATMPVLSAPWHSAADPASETPSYEEVYHNINPFTSLLAEGNATLDELQGRYPVAVDANIKVLFPEKSAEERAALSVDMTRITFNYDVLWARLDSEFSQEDNNLTAEICQALDELNRIQGLY